MSSHPDTVQLVKDLMQEVFGSKFAYYYNGDPEAIPIFNLPALIVTQSGDETETGAYGQDDVNDRITIKVVMNKRDDFDAQKVKDMNTTDKRVRDLVGLRNEETGRYETQTVKAAIRTLLMKRITAVAPNLNVEYGITPRMGGEGFADMTSEGHVSFTIQYVVNTNQ